MTAPAVAAVAAVIAALTNCGVRHVVVSPGSRSAPLARAAAAAEQRGDLVLHVRLDERSAGFLALGLAKVSGEPVAVMCTSGTAVVNLTPAVVEARYAGVPLVVITGAGHQRDDLGKLEPVLRLHDNTLRACAEAFG